MFLIDNIQVNKLISMQECIEVIRALFLLDFETEVVNPLRSKMALPNQNNGILGMMPGHIKPYGVMGIKVLTVFPNNYKKGFSSHQGIVHLFESETGKLLLSIEADEITAIRTAAVSALMTDLSAKDTSRNLCILGSGKQAEKHLEAMLIVRNIKRVTIWSKNIDNAKSFVERVKNKYNVDIKICKTVNEAAKDADIICTVTASNILILKNTDLKKGVHINAVGACTPNSRELEGEIVLNADVYVDSYESAINESGDLLIPAKEKNIDVREIIKANINEVLQNKSIINKSKTTVFNSLGLAIEDIAVAVFCYKKVKNCSTIEI